MASFGTAPGDDAATGLVAVKLDHLRLGGPEAKRFLRRVRHGPNEGEKKQRNVSAACHVRQEVFLDDEHLVNQLPRA